MKTIILSDIHLGSRNCNAEGVRRLLDETAFDRLILNGDTVNSVNFRKLRDEHWDIMSRFKQIARTRELVLIRGNHDHDGDYSPRRLPLSAEGRGEGNGNGHLGTGHLLPALLEVPMREECMLEVGSRRYAVLHGDRFDPTLRLPVVEVADWCYQVSQQINKRLAKWLKKKSKRWCGVLELIRRETAAYAEALGLDGIITGHTHFAEDVHIGGVHYVNTGCWTDHPSTYVSIDDANLRLHYFPNAPPE